MKLLFLILNTLFLILVSFTPIFAADTTGLVSDLSPLIAPKTGTFKITDIGALASTIVSWGLVAASVMVLIFLVWGGIQWMGSGGDKNALESAKGRLTATVFGAALVVSVWAIFIILKNVLGLPILGGGSPSGPDGTTPDVSAWVCTAYPCNCCNQYSGQTKKCCEQINNLAPRCLFGNPKASAAECRQTKDFRMDFNCWSEEYSNLVKSGRLNPSTDACE